MGFIMSLLDRLANSANRGGSCTTESRSERLGIALAAVASNRALIEAVAAEMSTGIEGALRFWMSQIEEALRDPGLTTLGRMHAVQEILNCYHRAYGNTGGPRDGYAA